jgi:hypothetical protein
MSKKTAIAVFALFACTGIALAATNLGRVTGNGYDYSDLSNACCPKIRYPSSAVGELNKACKDLGGRYVKNEKFVEASYCETYSNPDGGWKYKCRKAVVADCMK